MIPKILHLCWFGKGEYPPLVRMCLDSWKHFLPDYEIHLWNEDSFDVNSVRFTKEAAEAKKWAFVSDYVRLYALEKEGGIYLDTDLELIGDPTPLLDGKSFVASFIEGGLISAGFLAAEPECPFVSDLLGYYKDRPFLKEDGSQDTTMNPLIYSRIAMEKYGLLPTDREYHKNGFDLFPLEVFMPYHKNILNRKNPYDRKNYRITDRTVAIHHDMGSWAKRSKVKSTLLGVLRLLLPDRLYLGMKEAKNRKTLRS